MVKALVVRAPGINCDRETAYACLLAGFEAERVHVNQLFQDPERLLDYHFLVIPGGFSYGDDLGAGTLLAKNLALHLGKQLQQFIAEGRPLLGICNGFQVLVRAGLLPDQAPSNGEERKVALHASLTDNSSAQFECRWITLNVLPGPCVFTQGIAHPIELPVAHGEGQCVIANADVLAQVFAQEQVPLVYSDGRQAIALSEGGQNEARPFMNDVAYPANPNGSVGNIAGICNVQGNVLGLMPHPERYVHALQHPLRRGTAKGDGDGLLLFKNAYTYASTLKTHVRSWGSLPKKEIPPSPSAERVYAASGVDLAAADAAKELMKDAVRATQGVEVLAGMGAFAGVYTMDMLQQMRRPALVASTDGVGTKTLVAAQAGRFEQIGYDLVNHSVNDLLTQGARPLFFLDYLAMGKLAPEQAAAIVQSVAAACRDVGCALLGGETAEMPDVYRPEAFDLAGTIVGVVEQDEIVNGRDIRPGDVLLGLPSSGLHTNGYSLARRVFAPYALDTVFPSLGEPLGNALLRPHRCYLREIELLRDYLADRDRSIKGIVHITGGGFTGNIARILPSGMQAIIETKRWHVPPLFALIAELGQVSMEEMYRTLNMGVGMVLVLSSKGAIDARCVLPELLSVGYIAEGEGVMVQ